jgi:hypothetical protein
MFTIDLLKGEGVPIRRGPEAIVFAAVGSIVPLIIAVVMVSLYTTTTVTMAVQKQQIADLETKTEGLSDAVRLQGSFEQEKVAIYGCLAEVSATIGSHVQWSPILVTVVEHVPDSMLLTKLEVKEATAKKMVPMKDDPQRMVPRSVMVKQLLITVSGDSDGNHHKVVRDFSGRLRSSPVLAPQIEDITFTQKHEKIEDRNMVSYEIECVFKPRL